ncbi:MAG: MBL fold metallo-hydrolase [Bacteroidales bacterium]|nr:MAG: MBL fold metallo-hydrolase [Bacteroidales bacterium]
MSIKTFLFNPFQENTYVLYDQSGECVVIDAGNYHPEENDQLYRFFLENSLEPVRVINTHCHIDHIFGNGWFHKEYKIKTEAHKLDEPLLQGSSEHAQIFGVTMKPPPAIGKYLNEGDRVVFGNSTLHCIHVPGHSPGSLAYYNEEEQFILVGDVLFQGSIGRTDLPGGDYTTLIRSITDKLFTLDDEVVVYSGHGPATTIGNERQFNPFFS